jgi:Rieske Fe-S protein
MPADDEVIALDKLPPCYRGKVSRRDFCAGMGVGLIALTLPACDAGPPGGTGATSSGTGGTSGDTTGGTTGTSTGGTTGGSGCPSAPINGGDASAIAAGTAKRLRSGGADIWLCRDGQGLYALDNHCTHQGRAVLFEGTTSGFYCPAHGATYNFNGDNPTDPAFYPLDHFAVCIDSSGAAWIDPSTTVSSTTRA